MKKIRNAEISKTELTIKNEIIALCLLFVTLFLIFSLVSYSPQDPSFFHTNHGSSLKNYCGRVGAEISAIFMNLFGYASYVVVLFMLFITSFFLFNRQISDMFTKCCGYLLLFISLAGLIPSIKPFLKIDGMKKESGGLIGNGMFSFFQGEIKGFFTFMLFFVLLQVSLILITRFSFKHIAKNMLSFFLKIWLHLEKILQKQIEQIQRKYRLKKIKKKYPEENEKSEAVFEKKEKNTEDKRAIVKKPSRIPEEAFLFDDMEPIAVSNSKYQAPPVTYLDASTGKSQIDYQELEDKKEELGLRLNEFKIRGNIVEYTPGPVITTYEFVPDIGVKVKDVTNLSEDLALVARAQYVRIERILGKKAIGIEIPNKKREIIHLREIIESAEFKSSNSPLSLAIGKTKNGEIFIADLREMPHLIIAGATGSGKSVAIHMIILSILYKASPEEVKFILIDPKRVELAIYNSLPHLLTPVVVNTKLAKNALDWAVYEMEERYKKLAMLQVRNIEQYNKKLELLKNSDDELLPKAEEAEKIPYIVIVIDEFADLMMESSREIEEDVARIAQKARAVGIHLILATQRPSIDVITGTIKNNFPSRIALAVPSKHDSRTIIDVMGAEKLLGHGDMLFLPPKTASLIRLHCAYVSEEEALRVVHFLAKQERPKFNTQVVKPKTASDEEISEDGLDDMFYDAAELIINTGHASASFLQRKLSIGYARAGRLMDQLEARGVVSAPNSKNQRDVLMSMEELETDKESESEE